MIKNFGSWNTAPENTVECRDCGAEQGQYCMGYTKVDRQELDDAVDNRQVSCYFVHEQRVRDYEIVSKLNEV